MILGGVLQNNLRAIKEFSFFIPQNVWWTYSNNYVYLKYMVLLTLRIEICGYKKCLRLAQKFLIRKTQSWFLICEKFLKTYLIFKELTELLTFFFPNLLQILILLGGLDRRGHFFYVAIFISLNRRSL